MHESCNVPVLSKVHTYFVIVDIVIFVQQGPEEGAGTGDTSNPINQATPPVEEPKTIPKETAPQTKRQRRRSNPFKVRTNSNNLG